MQSATQCVDDVGNVIDFSLISLALLASMARQSVHRWRWRRVEKQFPALNSAGAGRGPAWRAVLAVLRMKDCTV